MDKFYPARFEPWKDGQDFYDHYNYKYFNGRLPVVYVGFYKRPDHLYGSTIHRDDMKYVSHILLNPYFRNWNNILLTTLLHEMIHVKHNNRYGHGKRFKKERRRLIQAGAFDELL